MTRYDFFRKRIAPVLFLGMVGLIAYDSCEKERDLVKGTLVFEVGDVDPRVRGIEGQLVVRGRTDGDSLRCTAPDGMRVRPCRFEVRLPAPDGELHLTVDFGDARRTVKRTFRLQDGGTTHVDLTRDLVPPAREPSPAP